MIFMANAAAFVAWIALIGATASFVAGAALCVRALAGSGFTLRVLAAVAWPFARARAKAAARDEGARLDKALVACIACLMIAAAAWSAAANLYRFAR